MKRRPRGSLRSAGPFHIVFVTSPRKEAKRLAQGVLSEKLAACVNVVPGIRSWYWWKGKVASDPEVLLILKTVSAKLRLLHRWILKNHPYEIPEFLAFSVNQGDSAYLRWLQTSLGRS